MSKHMPEIPPANRTTKGPTDAHQEIKNTEGHQPKGDVNTAEQGDTANIKQNTTNKGAFQGRRVK